VTPIESTTPEPGFEGDADDLAAFRALIATPVRSNSREAGLAAWGDYKLQRQMDYVRGAHGAGRGKHGSWQKGDYIRSLTAPAVDLRGARFADVCLGYADLRGVRLDGARFEPQELDWMAFKGGNFQHASLRGTRFRNARFMDADFRWADLTGAHLEGADLSGTNFGHACLRDARLRGANLQGANLVRADLRGADLRGARVYGVAAWDVLLDDQEWLRRDLVVTPDGEADVTADSIEVAQFVYLLLSNPRIRGAIDTVCRKGVLILGRFTEGRKEVLDGLRDALRQRGFVPMIFDFEKPSERDFTETVKTLASLSRFIVADITNPRSSPLELQATVPDFMVPLVPIIAEGERPFAMFQDLWIKHHWVLDPLEYPDRDALVRVLNAAIIEPALRKHAELMEARAQSVRTRKVSDYAGE
jgi:hypothetical protein